LCYVPNAAICKHQNSARRSGRWTRKENGKRFGVISVAARLAAEMPDVLQVVHLKQSVTNQALWHNAIGARAPDRLARGGPSLPKAPSFFYSPKSRTHCRKVPERRAGGTPA
jgi:hypothetical protein